MNYYFLIASVLCILLAIVFRIEKLQEPLYKSQAKFKKIVFSKKNANIEALAKFHSVFYLFCGLLFLALSILPAFNILEISTFRLITQIALIVMGLVTIAVCIYSIVSDKFYEKEIEENS